MSDHEERRDPGEFYPGGKVWKVPGTGGGGAGEDTNAVHYYGEAKTAAQKAQARSNIGAMAADTPIPSVGGKLPVKPLPKYLHARAFDDSYKADAEAWYESLAPDAMGGACSAVRRGGKMWRNYDWTFDSAAEFVVRMSAAEGRHASVGVASLGAALTEDEVMSGVYTAKYRALPGMTLDGINDAGVVAEINVDGGPKTDWHGDAEDDGIHILAAVRWVLDHGETAEQAAEWIADHIIQPTGGMNFHFMVADAEKTYIVENGVAHDVTNGTKVLTNYGVFDAAQAGGGKERYNLLAGGADISAVHWTKAYQQGNTWHSDFESEAQHAAAIEQWAAQGTDKEAHRGKTTTSGKPWWQTVHTCECDFAAKTLRVAVQESGEYFTFAAGAKAEVAWGDVKDKPETFPPSSHTHAQSQVTGLDSALEAKRDKTDLRVFDWPTEDQVWTFTNPISLKPHIIRLNYRHLENGLVFDGWIDSDGESHFPMPSYWRIRGDIDSLSGTIEFMNQEGLSYEATATRAAPTPVPSQEDTLAKKSEVAAAIAEHHDATKQDALTSAQLANIDAVPKKADEFTEWELSGDVESGHSYEVKEYPVDETYCEFVLERDGDWFDSLDGRRRDSLTLNFVGQAHITATRKRVLRTGEAVASFAPVGGVTPSVVGGVADLADLFSESNTSLTGTIRYSIEPIEASNRSILKVNVATTDTEPINVIVPAPEANKVIDFEVWITVAAGVTTVPQINYGYMVDETFTPVTLFKKGGENPAYEKDASSTVTNIVHFTSSGASGYTVVAAAFK